MEVFIGNPLNGDKAKVDSNGRLLTSSTSLTRYEESSAEKVLLMVERLM
jgi:hypothetical protein